MITCAWLWVYIGAGLVLLELVVPGFILCFFGLSAATVGVLRFALGECFTLTWQLAAFSAFSVLYILLLRRFLKRIFVGSQVQAGTDFEHESVGRIGRVTQGIRPPLSGRVMIGDSEWTAVADSVIEAGLDVKVIAQDNLTMKVVAI